MKNYRHHFILQLFLFLHLFLFIFVLSSIFSHLYLIQILILRLIYFLLKKYNLNFIIYIIILLSLSNILETLYSLEEDLDAIKELEERIARRKHADENIDYKLLKEQLIKEQEAYRKKSTIILGCGVALIFVSFFITFEVMTISYIAPFIN